MSQYDDKAAVVICLGINPYSSDKTMQGLVVCSGILDYFRAIHGRGYIMTVNFSGTRLLQAKTPAQAAACLREDCPDWASVLDRAAARLRRDAPPGCRHVEVVLVGTDDVPSRVRDPAAACAALRARGVRVNSILLEPPADDGGDGGAGAGRGGGPRVGGGGWRVLDGSPTSERADSWYEEPEEEASWGMVRLARETGGLSLLPNTEGKLAMHQLFSEMFRRWGEGYWKSASAGQR